MNCPVCKADVNPYHEMQVNGSFVSRCPRQNCLSVINTGEEQNPAVAGPVEVSAKEDAPAVVVDLPGKPSEVSGVIEQLEKRRDWLEARMDELARCSEELAVVNRMLQASEDETETRDEES